MDFFISYRLAARAAGAGRLAGSAAAIARPNAAAPPAAARAEPIAVRRVKRSGVASMGNIQTPRDGIRIAEFQTSVISRVGQARLRPTAFLPCGTSRLSGAFLPGTSRAAGIPVPGG